MTAGEQIQIGECAYEIVRVREFAHLGKQRKSLILRKPSGKRLFNAVAYETGKISSVVPI